LFKMVAVDFLKWRAALLSTLLISSLPNVFLYLMPSNLLLKKSVTGINIQNILLCFASGGLLGDVLLHTLPHLLFPHDHDHHSEPHRDLDSSHRELHESTESGHTRALYIGSVVLGGFLVFFLSERLLSLNLHSKPQHNNRGDKVGKVKSQTGVWSFLPHSLPAMGWLNIAADMMHNFTDGVAMGASYASSSAGGALGVAATLSILFHEVPHEIGDFSILLQSGVSKSKAIQIQFMTSVAAFIGTVVGLMSDGEPAWRDSMLAFTSGGFIYVATVSLLPSILATQSVPLLQVTLEGAGFAIGVGMMVAVALLEHD